MKNSKSANRTSAAEKRANRTSSASKRAKTSSSQMETSSHIGKTTRSHSTTREKTSSAKNCGK
jgi:hypothetical protein